MKLTSCIFLGFITISTVITTSTAQCDSLGVNLYRDLGCIPHYDECNICPIKYTCQGLGPWDKYCHFRGQTYANTEIVEDSLSSSSCDKACFCSISESVRPSFICAVLDCPEWLGVRPKPGCYLNYSLDDCCSVGEICPPFDDLEKCVVEGKEYMEGQAFLPKNSCMKCVCQKGFADKIEEPFCKPMPCGQQLKNWKHIQNRCAPLYEKNLDALCCPIGWVCPDGTEVIGGDSRSDDVCVFGEMVLKIGQVFEKFNVISQLGKRFSKIECKCIIPPLLTCTDVN